MSHLYGDTLYYATSLFDHYVYDIPYSRPEPYYFWLYYFLMNFIWIVIPFCKYRILIKFSRGADRLTLCMIRLPGRQHPHTLGCDSGPAGVRREA
jgi:hypothetical protein